MFSTGGIGLSLLYIARTDSPIIDNIYNNVPSLQVGHFTFALSASEENDINSDYKVYALPFGEDTVELLIGLVDVTDNCDSRSSINLMEFMWESTLIFAFTKYGIVCVPLDSRKFLYFRHHGTARVDPFVPECTDSCSCRCHVCLRKPPSLRSLGSYTVFHIANNFSEFTLPSKTLYDHYLRAAESNTVPVDRLIPDSFPDSRRTYARGPCSLATRYHKSCIDPVQFPWYAHTGEYCESKEEIIARSYMEKNEWW